VVGDFLLQPMGHAPTVALFVFVFPDAGEAADIGCY
jgi:hypothetical protein